MDSKKPFYQKLPVWIALSFLSGATVMVAALVLYSSDPVNSTLTFQAPQSTQVAADSLLLEAEDSTQVVILRPSDGEAVSSSDSVTIAATASNGQGITNMAVWVDNQLAKTCVASQCSLTVPVSGLPSLQTHTIQVMANGLDGTSGSALSHFIVQD